MIRKEFVLYEQALELKQLGFIEPCLAFYGINGDYLLGIDEVRFDNFNNYDYNFRLNNSSSCSAPLYSQAFRWFRDKKLSDMCICRYQGRNDGGVYYYYCITNDFGVEETRHFKEGFFTYEEAELACLKRLIEIEKIKKYKLS